METLGLSQSNIQPGDVRKATLILGQLLLGASAERAFEDRYRAEMVGREFDLIDLRESRSDTDYRLLNGNGRPIFRINIKFFGSQFRRAQELVGLVPEDTFALATYKIHSALEKQHRESLPYLFIIVGVAGLGAEVVGQSLPSEVVEAVALLSKSQRLPGKRNIEDTLVRHLLAQQDPAAVSTYASIAQADWFVLSARRAEALLKEKLFERAYALRIRGFARVFGGAELDMHFSLSDDLMPLSEFLAILRDEGVAKGITMAERGAV
ncbi:MAG: hypothetical protein HYX53_17300 [Chloroflexi bacterium]|nr:hypothetical protein [Chloroflexota bacterium]